MTFDTINEARMILQLPEHATMEHIKEQYRTLIKRWHPDSCEEAPETCEKMARSITKAYRVIQDYCAMYQYSFERDEVKKYLTEDDWWRQRFGSDPIWGV